MTPKNRPKASSDASSRGLTATHKCLNHIPYGSKPLKAAFVNLKGDPQEK
jgi:hypothetical protein